MSKKKLFDDDSDEDIALKTENEYAKKYDTWREKEEIHKLEQKYGPDAVNADGSLSSDSDDESDEPLEVSEETEAEFLKTLALLKTKDPRIYDPNFKCFKEDEQKETVKETKSKTLTFEDSDEDSDQDGDIFKIEKKAEVEETIEKEDDTKSNKKKAGKIKQYLTGQSEHIDDEVEKDLAPLKALWSDPKLNEGEAFLRDYILNKKYLEEGDVGSAGLIRDDDALEADEATVEEQAKFERAYNFRFEEPDEEYLKRFPRTMNYIRPKDDRRARKRAEVRERKEEEKRKRMEEIGRLKALKLKEIQEKIEKIKEVTGNQDLAFKEEDIEGDFDPREHDRRMRALFDEQFYGQADDTKPVFPDLDEELEIENWDNYEVDNQDGDPNRHEDGPHCEDDDFNMDAEYDPRKSRQNLLEEIQKTLGKKRRNRKRQSKLSQLLAADKPKFLPLAADRTYADHMEEYYKLDCEDIVGGMPTRFKYREVVPNDYGLSVEEILVADDKELTQWVPLKKIVKYRADAAERGDVTTYRRRAKDDTLKRRLLPSLYRDLPLEPEVAVPLEQTKKKKKKKNNKNVDVTTADNISEDISNKKHKLKQHNSSDTAPETPENESVGDTSENKKAKRKRKLENADMIHVSNKNESDVVNDNEISTKTKKVKKKSKNNYSFDVSSDTVVHEANTKDETVKKKNKLNNPDTGELAIKKQAKEDNFIKIHVSTTNESDEMNDSEISTKTKKVKKKSKNKNSFDVSSNTLVDEANTKDETVKKKKSKKKNKLNNPDTGELTIKKQAKEDNLSKNLENNVINNKMSKKKQKFKSNKAANVDTGKAGKKPEKILNKKNKFKNKNKVKRKGNTTSSDNPLGKLSDERLKAYGLNPKKYRGFLKYKKF